MIPVAMLNVSWVQKKVQRKVQLPMDFERYIDFHTTDQDHKKGLG